LALWLARDDHPLTARVIVNRLWQHHFGRGIVATPNDFGAMGELPSHPELLDWLAVELVENDWSLKHIHRLMVTSATYCQASRIDADSPQAAHALRTDGENRWLWRAHRRRLEGEAIRDAMLHVSGELNTRMFGPSSRPPLPAGLSQRYAWEPDQQADRQGRRSVYVFVKRNMRFPLFDVFDLPDLHQSCATRTATVTAPQALLMLNSEFTEQIARRWARRLLAECGDDTTALVARAYREAFGRAAEQSETAAAVEFLSRQQALADNGSNLSAENAVSDFCQAMLNANEFVYVD
jgi:hypothetical protein